MYEDEHICPSCGHSTIKSEKRAMIVITRANKCECCRHYATNKKTICFCNPGCLVAFVKGNKLEKIAKEFHGECGEGDNTSGTDS